MLSLTHISSSICECRSRATKEPVTSSHPRLSHSVRRPELVIGDADETLRVITAGLSSPYWAWASEAVRTVVGTRIQKSLRCIVVARIGFALD